MNFYKKTALFLFLFLLLSLTSKAQNDLSYYLPQKVNYNNKIPTPKQVLDFEIGDWHLSHFQLVSYLKTLSKSSDRIQFTTYGRTYENRPLLLLTISSPTNLAKIEQLQKAHLALSDPKKSATLDTQKMPSVVWLGYSVHGNEASGSNAAALVAYYWAAAQGSEIDKILENTIILLDPSYNPDGMQRFSSWVNSHKSKNLITDPVSREFNEVWPGGRTNHYWFDLNRDWLPVQLKESKARVAQYQKWRPNILTDHHEMQTNSTFFFQPGIISRKNPLTPNENVNLTKKISLFHASALDSISSMYYSNESFDDFYFGKGSTYPDIQGSVGILFEQASARGHAQKGENGIVTFPFAIKNHFTASISTVLAAQKHRVELLNYQRKFYQSAISEAENNNLKAFVFGDEKDAIKNFHFIEMLRKHKIEVYQLSKKIKIGKQNFSKENSYIVPLKQPQSRLIQSIFETRTTFEDSLFYDVSAWTMPLAFGIRYNELTENDYKLNLLGIEIKNPILPKTKLIEEQTSVAYAFEWDSYDSPKLLYELFQNDIKAKVLTKKATYQLSSGKKKVFSYGSIVIPLQIQKIKGAALYSILNDLAIKNHIPIYALKKGLSEKGADVGSPSLKLLKTPKILLLAGEGSTSYEVGEVWYLLDQRYNIGVTVIDQAQLHKADLHNYTVIVMVNGSYNNISGVAKNNLKSWVRKNGTLILTKNAVKWGKQNGLNKITFKIVPKPKDLPRKSYSTLEATYGAKRIGGAIFEAELDLSHPIGYGFRNSKISVFRNHTLFAEKHTNPFANPLIYSKKPLQSGYISDSNLKQVSGSAAIIINSYGQGKIISMIDNPNFRGFWYGTNKLFMNAIFFGHIINVKSGR